MTEVINKIVALEPSTEQFYYVNGSLHYRAKGSILVEPIGELNQADFAMVLFALFDLQWKILEAIDDYVTLTK